MTGTRLRFPSFDGSVNVSWDGRKFSIVFEERSITIAGNERDLESTIFDLKLKLNDLGEVRKISKMMSSAGITLKINDSKGTVLSIGKGIWTPLGHLSFKPRIRRYIGGRKMDSESPDKKL